MSVHLNKDGRLLINQYSSKWNTIRMKLNQTEILTWISSNRCIEIYYMERYTRFMQTNYISVSVNILKLVYISMIMIRTVRKILNFTFEWVSRCIPWNSESRELSIVQSFDWNDIKYAFSLHFSHSFFLSSFLSLRSNFLTFELRKIAFFSLRCISD